jgi:hypothetical protein
MLKTIILTLTLFLVGCEPKLNPRGEPGSSDYIHPNYQMCTIVVAKDFYFNSLLISQVGDQIYVDISLLKEVGK